MCFAVAAYLDHYHTTLLQIMPLWCPLSPASSFHTSLRHFLGSWLPYCRPCTFSTFKTSSLQKWLQQFKCLVACTWKFHPIALVNAMMLMTLSVLFFYQTSCIAISKILIFIFLNTNNSEYFFLHLYWTFKFLLRSTCCNVFHIFYWTVLLFFFMIFLTLTYLTASSSSSFFFSKIYMKGRLTGRPNVHFWM